MWSSKRIADLYFSPRTDFGLLFFQIDVPSHLRSIRLRCVDSIEESGLGLIVSIGNIETVSLISISDQNDFALFFHGLKNRI